MLSRENRQMGRFLNVARCDFIVTKANGTKDTDCTVRNKTRKSPKKDYIVHVENIR